MNLPDHDIRERSDKSAYHIPTFNGSVVATVKGLKLGDFYRSEQPIQPPKEKPHVP